ncbi:polysaccharide biosynthesis/export family protein [Phenylobacterium immobile]|uniref:polysaccharide biosynthesis/export family protein n=1 Tax=Phenylobacterium immobile TaxID=21 RepID=UPI000A5BE31E|nr:polysaccharide biosynthesis/export family protein [Phenylobacterium immobile]
MQCKAGRLKKAALGLFAVLLAFAPAGLAQAQTISDVLSRAAPAQTVTERAGQATAAEGGPVVQSAIGQKSLIVKPDPFGASLFTNTAAMSSDAINPEYVIQSGDRISVSIMGGADVTAGGAPSTPQSIVVDAQGNVFLPDIGPVHVAGMRADSLQPAVAAAASRVFTSRVNVYAVLETTHKVGVYVAGYVLRPGRYGGSASDSALDYLIRAGGVDPSRGSYRNIQVLRNGLTVYNIDLYQFLLTGEKPGALLREGDTILVGEQNAMVEVAGAVRNAYLFELPGREAPGSEIIGMARPLPSATNAAISGTRDTKPYSTYLTLGQLATTPLRDQDKVIIVGDEPAGTVRVRVEGSRIGPSYLVLPSDTRLPAALEQINVNPALADKGSVYILRDSVAEQQQRVIEEALDRLQRQLFLAVSPTASVSTIRASEAQLVSTYIEKARRSPAEGRVVVTNTSGQIADVRLEEGDVIVIPARSQTVLVSGEVLSPQAVLWEPQMKAGDYVKRVGGYSERGRPGKWMIRRANGEMVTRGKGDIRAGDELIILPYIDPKLFQIGVDLTSLVYQVAVASAALNGLNN